MCVCVCVCVLWRERERERGYIVGEEQVRGYSSPRMEGDRGVGAGVGTR